MANLNNIATIAAFVTAVLYATWRIARDVLIEKGIKNGSTEKEMIEQLKPRAIIAGARKNGSEDEETE